MEVKAAAPRCQLLLILVMSAVMLLPGTNCSLLLVQRRVTRTIVLQETIGKDFNIDYLFSNKEDILLTCENVFALIPRLLYSAFCCSKMKDYFPALCDSHTNETTDALYCSLDGSTGGFPKDVFISRKQE
ncbi:hypothetical protein STEG23_001688, partial [Scotinomys teguina]